MACPPHYSFTNLTASPCLPSCPLGYYSHEEYNVSYGLNLAWSIAEIISGILVLIPFLAIPSRRRWPSNLLAILFATVIVVGVGGLIPTLANGNSDWRKFSCKNDYTATDRHTPSCAVSFVFTYGAAMFAACIWFCLSCNLALTALHSKIPSLYRMIASLTYALTIAIGGCIVNLVVNAVQGAPANGGACFINAQTGNGWYYYSTWTIPLSAMFVMGTINIGITAYSIIHRAVQGMEKWSWKAVQIFVNYQPRIIIFLLIFWYAVLVENSFTFYTIRFKHLFATSTLDWYGCLAETWEGADMNGTAIDTANALALATCGQPHVPRHAIVTWVSLSVDIPATLMCWTFLCDINIVQWWSYLLRGKTYEDLATIDQSRAAAVSEMASPRSTSGSSLSPRSAASV